MTSFPFSSIFYQSQTYSFSGVEKRMLSPSFVLSMLTVFGCFIHASEASCVDLNVRDRLCLNDRNRCVILFTVGVGGGVMLSSNSIFN